MKLLTQLSEKLSPSLRRLAAMLPAHKGKLACAVGFMLTAGASSSLIAALLGKLTNAGFYNQEAWVVLAAPAGLILIAFLHGGSMFMSNYLLGKVSQSMLIDLRREMFHKILRWPAEEYQKNQTGIVTSKFVFEANYALGRAAKSAITLIRDTVQVIALTVMLFWNNWTLALVSLLIGPCVAWLLRYISRRLKTVMGSSQHSIAEVLVRVKEAYEAERVIKVANTYDEEVSRFNALNVRLRDLAVRMTKVSSLGTPLTQLFGMSGVAVVLTAAMYQTQAGLITMGDFVTFLAALLLIMPPLRHLAGLNATFVMMNVAAESIFNTLDTPLERDEGKTVLGRVRGEVQIEDVSLRYPNAERDAVSHVTITARPGDVVALVGLSGSGKTSLVNMIPRFWNPTSGRILIDGVDAQDATLESLRSQIAIVSQDVLIFDDTIRANIAYAKTDATEEEIRRAVDAAALTEFIDSLPEGLDTPAGEAGDRLSGGQKQRISIARALLKDAPILILDEATSALDSKSELQIRDALAHLMKGRTTFIVAHRLSSIADATQIFAFDAGRVVESGTWAELARRDGLFARLCRLQGIDPAAAASSRNAHNEVPA
ncbi:lipid A export permease/ATP-binding protein MsbA [uncultured Sutterella sp.]|uniref:lipid A export permease/ATP-binding protein MsbA n=1 Tax=uncultured Sutterella sp. TaxID=286133 RepID=UPI0025CE0CA5|nr:lipid A export permease/ATP-binding protein MsbA [uncultured Sutterella sp.]